MNTNYILAWLVSQIKEHDALGGIFEGRIFPDKAKQGTKNPCLIYQLLGSEFEEHLDHRKKSDSELSVQIRVYASSRALANELRDSISKLLNADHCGRQSIDYSGSAESFRILRSHFSGYSDTFEEGNEPNGDDYGAIGVWSADVAE